MESDKNFVYGFMRHCMQDEEANRGGIPSREKHWLKKLGWAENSPETLAFYEVWKILWNLNNGAKVSFEQTEEKNIISYD